MTTRLETDRRLEIARRYLDEARQAEQAGLLRDAAAAARACVENACKAVIARFGAVPRTHDPDEVLARLLRRAARVRAEERRLIGDLIRISRGYGVTAHLRLSYGDDKTGETPWEIATETVVRQSLADADAALATAEKLATPADGPDDSGSEPGSAPK